VGFGALEHPLRARIPTGDDSVQIFRDDGVIGGFHHSGEPGVRLFSSLLRGDVDLTLADFRFSISWCRSLDWRRAGGDEVLGYRFKRDEKIACDVRYCDIFARTRLYCSRLHFSSLILSKDKVL